jgi:hypothetical protein
MNICNKKVYNNRWIWYNESTATYKEGFMKITTLKKLERTKFQQKKLLEQSKLRKKMLKERLLMEAIFGKKKK